MRSVGADHAGPLHGAAEPWHSVAGPSQCRYLSDAEPVQDRCAALKKRGRPVAHCNAGA